MHHAKRTSFSPPLLRLLGALSLLFLLSVGLEACGKAPTCENGISSINLNPTDSSCAENCECNNQNYTGACVSGKCIAYPRDSCTSVGESQACDTKFSTSPCKKGIRTCRDTGLKVDKWGDCKCPAQGGEASNNENPGNDATTEPAPDKEEAPGKEETPGAEPPTDAGPDQNKPEPPLPDKPTQDTTPRPEEPGQSTPEEPGTSTPEEPGQSTPEEPTARENVVNPQPEEGASKPEEPGQSRPDEPINPPEGSTTEPAMESPVDSGPSCKSNETDCNGTCVDTQSDDKNCGSCNNQCLGGKTCQSRACKCPSGQTDCSGTCIDTQKDDTNCGACGTMCSNGKTCQNGTCKCVAPLTDCNGTCVNQGTDPKNCNACGTTCVLCKTGTCLTVTHVAIGVEHACATMSDKTLYCWGINGSYFKVGAGTTTTPQYKPIQVPNLTNVKSAALGNSHSCALLYDGTVQCWGSNSYGELGRGTTSYNETTPASVKTDPISNLTNVAQVWTGQAGNWALRNDQKVFAWGWNNNAQLLIGSTGTPNEPYAKDAVALMGTKQIAPGYLHRCAIQTDGAVFCWPGATFGGMPGLLEPIMLPASTKAAKVASGQKNSCAMLEDGRGYCWGTGPLKGTSNSPVQIKNPGGTGYTNIIDIAHTYGSTCILLLDKTVRCFGAGKEMGDGKTTPPLQQNTPVQPTGLTNVKQLFAGTASFCALTDGGLIYCWGDSKLFQTQPTMKPTAPPW